MDLKDKKKVAAIAADLAAVFSNRPYSYRIQEAEDQDGIKTTVILRVAYASEDKPLPVRIISQRPVEAGALVRRKWHGGGPVMTAERKARNGWEGWYCSWTSEEGYPQSKWIATEDLEVVS